MSAQRSCPAGFVGRGGASVVRRRGRMNRTEDLHVKVCEEAIDSRPQRRLCRLQSPRIAIRREPKKKAVAGSKQSRVIAMLRSPDGATIAAMMKATGWQQHSVRGFLAGVVRKKLKLKLDSKKIDGNRVYRIEGADSARQAAGNRSAARPDRHAACEGRSGAAGPQDTRRRDRAPARSRRS